MDNTATLATKLIIVILSMPVLMMLAGYTIHKLTNNTRMTKTGLRRKE